MGTQSWRLGCIERKKREIPINQDLLPSSDFFRRSTETSSDIVDFSAGSGGDRFERSFQTFGCLVSRQGRLFVKSLNREDQGRQVALLMSEQTGAGTADGASPISSSIGVVGVGRTGTRSSSNCCGVCGGKEIDRGERLAVAIGPRREERVQAPSTEPVPFLPWSRLMLCEADVDVGISQMISMFGNRSVVQ
jgi:hypothetical protein